MTDLCAESKDDFLQKLSEKTTDTETADFRIVSCGKEYKVHKFVLGLHSRYFDRLFKSPFVEANQNRIVLKEDPNLAVANMLQYFYTFRYDIAYGEAIDHTSSEVVTEDEMGFPIDRAPDAIPFSDLEAHAHVYTIADKYDIPKLKTLAESNFLHEALLCAADAEQKDLHRLLQVVPYVYVHCLPGEKGLRPSIVEAWSAKAEVVNKYLGDQNLRDLIEGFPDLGFDLFKGLVNNRPGNSRRGRDRGARDGYVSRQVVPSVLSRHRGPRYRSIKELRQDLYDENN